jgi:hypothetical protein
VKALKPELLKRSAGWEDNKRAAGIRRRRKAGGAFAT